MDGLDRSSDHQHPSGECVPVGEGRRGFVDARFRPRTNDRQIAIAIKAARNPQANLDTVTNAVTQARESYEATHALSLMCAANCDPGFWRALSAAGSGEGLLLHGLAYVNPDPGFWSFMAGVSQACGRNCTSNQVATRARRAGYMVEFNITAREFRLLGLEAQYRVDPNDGGGGFCILGHSNGRCKGGRVLEQVKYGSKGAATGLSIAAVVTWWAPPASLFLGAASVAASGLGTVAECIDGGKTVNCGYSILQTTGDALTFGYSRGATTTIHKVVSWGAGGAWVLLTTAQSDDDGDPPPSCPSHAPTPEMGGGNTGC